MNNFVHLHLHSHYSLLDGAIKIDDIIAKAGEFNMSSVAMTDHGNMFGAVEFYEKAAKTGIKPIIGCEMYVAKTSIKDREVKTYNHLILLAKNDEGYRNLARLVSLSYTKGFYYKPRTDKSLLSAYHEGLIALSACIKGEIPQSILNGRMDQAEEAVKYYRNLFGEDFYLEMQIQGLEEQKVANGGLLELSGKFGVPLVATNDCHYLLKDDYEAHDVLLCIQTGKTVEDKDRMRFSTKDLYFRSQEEMEDIFRDYPPEAISNTKIIENKCNFSLDLKSKHHFPQYVSSKSAEDGQDIPALFEQRAKEGFEEIFVKNPTRSDRESYEKEPEIYRKRLEMEIDVIKKSNFSGYFLIVSDFITYAKEHGIPVGPGRGSAVGSLVAYCLRITGIDPIKYGLMFERFLNPERISMPDIDSDFCINGRDDVIKYVSKKYGEENVCQIITFGTMLAKAVIRDTGRALNMPYSEVDKIAKLVPERLGISLESAIKEEPKLKNLINTQPKIKKLIEIAKRLEGLARHASTHAAGVVISNKPIMDYMPLYKGSKDSDVVTTQYTGVDLEKLGFIKFDFLGLKTLTVMNDAISLINDSNKNKGEKTFNIYDIDFNDPKTFKLLSAADTTGVFQLESSGMKDLLNKLEPESFEDLIPLVALHRPGPLGSGMVDDFIKGRHGEGKTRYIHPQLKNILKETYGVILYQEQIMRIAVELAGFSMGEADVLRKGVGKKDSDLINQMREKFISGCGKNGIEKAKAEKIFSLIAKFGEYGFNKSHSTAYAYIAYLTAYLKANYKEHFTAALLSSEMSRTDKLSKIMEEAKTGMNPVRILPPSVNYSMEMFTINGGGEKETNDAPEIRIGLGAIKNVGKAAIDSILQVRKEGGMFKGLKDFCSRVDTRKVNKRVVESLIKSGALDTENEFGEILSSRKWMIGNLESIMEEANIEREKADSGQLSFDSLAEYSAGQASLERESAVSGGMYADDKKFLLACEKESLGFYLSGHPLDGYEEKIKLIGCLYAKDVFSDCMNNQEKSRDKTYEICGVISQLKIHKTKGGEKMASFVLNDREWNISAVFFPKYFAKYEQMLDTHEPVVLTGRVDFSNFSSDSNPDERSEGDDFNILESNIKIIGEKIEFVDTFKLHEQPVAPNKKDGAPPPPQAAAGNNIEKVCIIEIREDRIDSGGMEFNDLLLDLKNAINGSKGEAKVFLRLRDYEIELKQSAGVDVESLKSRPLPYFCMII